LMCSKVEPIEDSLEKQKQGNWKTMKLHLQLNREIKNLKFP